MDAGRRVLVVDDDAAVRGLVTDVLEAEGYRVDGVADTLTAREAVARGGFDLVILDIMLADGDGRDLLVELRRSSDVPVIMLSGRGHETDRIVGLKMGADDYVVKPFSPLELAARVASVLRRARSARSDRVEKMNFSGLSIDLTTREVEVEGQPVELTAREFELLAFLAGSPRQVFNREQLLEQVWDSRGEWQDPATVTEHVRRICRKIEQDPNQPRWITTVRSVGYRFEP